MPASALGAWSALTIFVIGVAYVATLAVGVAVHGLSEPIVDPILAVMEVLTLVSALAMVVLMAAVHDRAPLPRRIHGSIALSFTVVFAGITSAVHFVELTAVRQAGSGGIAWPSAEYAAELLAWDLFLGLALLFAAHVFDTSAPERGVRRGLLIGGALCVAGIIGPVAGNMRLQLVGVLGYAIVLPVTCLLLARLFRQESSS
ncbi:MAG TPA: hypothetical protein VFZ56_13545 [Gemmatimonadaceae bacterium]